MKFSVIISYFAELIVFLREELKTLSWIGGPLEQRSDRVIESLEFLLLGWWKRRVLVGFFQGLEQRAGVEISRKHNGYLSGLMVLKIFNGISKKPYLLAKIKETLEGEESGNLNGKENFL